jgi:hypothetical protein
MKRRLLIPPAKGNAPSNKKPTLRNVWLIIIGIGALTFLSLLLPGAVHSGRSWGTIVGSPNHPRQLVVLPESRQPSQIARERS